MDLETRRHLPQELELYAFERVQLKIYKRTWLHTPKEQAAIAKSRSNIFHYCWKLWTHFLSALSINCNHQLKATNSGLKSLNFVRLPFAFHIFKFSFHSICISLDSFKRSKSLCSSLSPCRPKHLQNPLIQLRAQ